MARIIKLVTQWRILAFLVLSTILLGGHAVAGHKTVATVNGTELTELDLQDKLDRLYPRSFFHGTSGVSKRNSLRPQALKEIIEDELLYQEAKRMKLEVDEKRIKDTSNATIKRLGGKQAFNSVLKQRGMTDKQYLETIEKNFLVEMIIEEEVKQKSKVTDDEIANHYEENKKKYLRPASRRIWHVAIKVDPASTTETRLSKKKRAEEVLRMAKEEGADLYQIAWDYSDGPFRVKGGDLGLVHSGRLDPSVDDVAFSLEEGQISDVIESLHGYHVIKVIKIEESKQLSLQDVSEKIKRELQESKKTQAIEALISRLREKAVIEVYGEEKKD